jgi:hypothetical protein
MMKRNLIVAVAGLAVVGGWWLLREEAPPPTEAVRPGLEMTVHASGELELPGAAGFDASEGAARVPEALQTDPAPALCVVRIVDESGQVLEDAQAWWLDSEAARPVEDITAGVVEAAEKDSKDVLLARAPGHLPRALTLERRSGGYELVLPEAESIFGVVHVDDDLPAEPIELRFRPQESPLAFLDQSLVEAARAVIESGEQRVTTDRDGRFRLDGQDPGWIGRVRLPFAYWFRTAPEGGTFERGQYGAALLARPGEFTFHLTRLPVLHGRIVWADDLSPISGASIMAQAMFEGGGSTPGASLGSDEQGAFTFHLSPSMQDQRARFVDPEQREPVRVVQMEFRAKSSLPLELEFEADQIGPDGDLGVIELLRGRRVHFRVVDQGGQPIEGAFAFGGPISAPTNSAGRGVISGIDPILEEMSFGAKGRRVVRVRLGAGATQENPLTVTLPPGNRLALRLVDTNGQVPDGVSLVLASEAPMFETGGEPVGWGLNRLQRTIVGDAFRSSTRSAKGGSLDLNLDQEGAVLLSCLADNVRITARVQDHNNHPLHEESFLGPADGKLVEREIVFSLQPIELRGRVIDSVGSPIPQARVRFGSKGGRADGEGRFVFTPLYPSSEPSLLEIRASGHPTLLREEMWLTKDEDLGDIVLPFGRTLQVETFDEAGAPLERTRLSARGEGFAPSWSQQIEPGLERFQDLPPQTVTLTLRYGWRTYTQVASEGAERVRFTVPVHGTLELLLPASLVIPEVGSIVAQVTAVADSKALGSLSFGQEVARSTGQHSLLPGRYSVRLKHSWRKDHQRHEEFLDGQWQVEIRPAEPTRLSLGD